MPGSGPLARLAQTPPECDPVAVAIARLWHELR
jgi:hypothetical protein